MAKYIHKKIKRWIVQNTPEEPPKRHPSKLTPRIALETSQTRSEAHPQLGAEPTYIQRMQLNPL